MVVVACSALRCAVFNEHNNHPLQLFNPKFPLNILPTRQLWKGKPLSTTELYHARTNQARSSKDIISERHIKKLQSDNSQPYTMGGTKRDTHHCPKDFKGNCRRAYSPAGVAYCSKHEYYCSVPGCTFRPLQGQACPKHGKENYSSSAKPAGTTDSKKTDDKQGEDSKSAGRSKYICPVIVGTEH